MVSWGIVTILTGFVHTATQFYSARYFLGVAESSFFPGMIALVLRARQQPSRIFALFSTDRAIWQEQPEQVAGQFLNLTDYFMRNP